MLSLAICDDEELTLHYYADYLKTLFRQMSLDFQIDLFSDSGLLLTSLYNGHRWNVYFLDIDMPLVDGMELGRKIRHLSSDCYLVYISIHREMVFDTFAVKPFRFIPKDEFHQRIEECIRAILQDLTPQHPSEEDYLSLEVPGNIIRYKISDIAYIQSLDKYVVIVTRDGKRSSSIRYKLSDLETKLSGAGMIRIHRSYLVNYDVIRAIHASEIVLDNGIHLPVSRYRLEKIKQEFRRLTL